MKFQLTIVSINTANNSLRLRQSAYGTLAKSAQSEQRTLKFLNSSSIFS